MTTIKLFMDFFYGRRSPSIDIAVNNQSQQAQTTCVGAYKDCRQHVIAEFQTELYTENLLEITMLDKTDQDLVFEGSHMIDHYVEIMDIEIDDIRVEHLLYGAGEFRHSMPDFWVTHMCDQGIAIDPIYPGSTQLRLNGTWSMHFSMPFWQWCAERA